MPSYSIQFRRGTSTDHSSFTGEFAEITVDITNNRIILHDGETPGGIPIAKLSDVPVDVGDLSDDLTHIAAATTPVSTGTWYGSRAFFVGGSDWTNKYIEYIDIDTLGNGTVGGANLNRRYFSTAVSDSNRIVTLGSRLNLSPGNTTSEYFDIASSATSYEFGNLTKIIDQATSTSDGLYGLMTGAAQGTYSEIAYITIQTPGDAQDFGDLSSNRFGCAAGGDQNIAIFAGGQLGYYFQNTIDTVSYSTPGTATSHGNLSTATREVGATSNDTRTVFHIGRTGHQSPHSKQVQYLTTATGGTATIAAGQGQYEQSYAQMTNNGTRLVSQGYYEIQNFYEKVQYQEMNTLATAQDFGILADGINARAAASGNP